MPSAAALGSAASSTGRRHDTLLVTARRARGPDARRHQHHLVTDDLVQGRRLFRRTDETADPEHLRLPGAGFDQIGHAEAIPGGVEIAVVVGSQHRDREDLQVRSGTGLHRRLHGLRIGMHGEECRAEFRHALDAARHGIADVV